MCNNLIYPINVLGRKKETWSKMGLERQSGTGTCFALAPLIPTFLLPTKVRVTLAGTSQTFLSFTIYFLN